MPPRAPQRKARTVESVDVLGAAIGVAPAGLHPPCLEGLTVAARADLAIALLRRQPDFKVVSPGRGKSHVAGGQQHHAVREFQPLQDGFGVADHLLKRLRAVVGLDDLHHLHLVELMLANHPAGVATGAARLGAKARAVPVRRRQRAASTMAPAGVAGDSEVEIR